MSRGPWFTAAFKTEVWRRQLGDEVQRLQDHAGGPVLVGRLQRVAHLALCGQRQLAGRCSGTSARPSCGRRPPPPPPRAARSRLPLTALVAPHPRFLSVQQVRQRLAVVDVGGRGQHRVDQLRPAVDADMGLHPEVPLLALGRLAHLQVPLLVLVLGRTGCADDRRIHDGALGDLDTAAVQMLIDCPQHGLAQLVPFEQVPELTHRGLVRHTLHAQINPDEATHRHRVVQGLFHRRIRRVEPQLQKVDPQHPLQGNRRPTARLADLRICGLHRRRQLWPRNNAVHIQQELGSAGRFPVLLSKPVSVVCFITTVLQ